MIFEVCKPGDVSGLKRITDLADESPVLSEEMLLMARWFRDNYYCTYYEAVKAMLPSGK